MKTTLHDETSGATLPPAPLRPELAERFLAAMQAASAAGGEDELERRLRQLHPAPLGVEREQNWLAGMQRGSARPSYRAGWLYRWSAAAALFLLCTAGSFLMLNGRAAASVPSGLACRSVVETRTSDSVQWQEGHTALRSCEVLYEDAFVLDGDEDSTITVRVPVRTQVVYEDEVI